MKKIILLALTSIALNGWAQQNYCDFEGTKVIHFGFCSGALDSMHVNLTPNGVNSSAMCAMYIRDTAMYDNLKIYPDNKLIDVSPYDFNSIGTPKIRMKLYTTAPAGTQIRLQLGTKLDNAYPSGIHSEFVSVTSVSNAWQLITFNYSGIPPGSMTGPSDVDKIVLLFNPGGSGQDTMYFDDLTGPELITSGIADREPAMVRLSQNTPNPAKEKTTINFELDSYGPVSLKIYDMVGNVILTLVKEENYKAGNHSVTVETSTLPNGVYFYTLEAGSVKKSMKMIVSN